MSNKRFNKLWPADQLIRKLKPARMTERKDVILTIELICGFELFNTRPYHNYEDFSTGYRVSDKNVSVEAEDLDDALKLFKEKLDEN